MSLHLGRPNETPPADDGFAGAARVTKAARRMADWLCLAAAPTFALMALLTAASSGPDMACMTVEHASPLGGMVPMYLLMSAFHLAPWLKLVSSRRGGDRRSDPASAARKACRQAGG
jgi:hypothetical protein